MNSFLHLISTLDENSHTRGIQFEKLCKWLLENHPLYSSKLKQVWLWDDWPERWGRDKGIDLVAEDFDGNISELQEKVNVSVPSSGSDAKYWSGKPTLEFGTVVK